LPVTTSRRITRQRSESRGEGGVPCRSVTTEAAPERAEVVRDRRFRGEAGDADPRRVERVRAGATTAPFAIVSFVGPP